MMHIDLQNQYKFKRFFSTYAGPADSNSDQDELDEIRNLTAPIVGDELVSCVVDYFNITSCPLVRN